MQPVTPRTTTGTDVLLALGDLDARLLLAELPGDGVRQHFLHGDAGGLAAARVHAGLGARLELLRAQRSDGDEAELAVHFAGEDEVAAHERLLACGNVPRISRATESTRLVRKRAAWTIADNWSTVRSRSSFTRQKS